MMLKEQGSIFDTLRVLAQRLSSKPIAHGFVNPIAMVPFYSRYIARNLAMTKLCGSKAFETSSECLSSVHFNNVVDFDQTKA